VTSRIVGAGLGFRTELAADLLASRESVDFVEVVAENCFADPASEREAEAISCLWPVALHGVKLSLGSAGGIDASRARDLGRLARRLKAPIVSEHAAITRGSRREIGHLTSIPYSRDSLAVLVSNIDRARRFLPDVPFLIENIAWTFRWPEDEMPEGTFYSELAERSGCPLLLDLSNLNANALNSGVASEKLLDSYPLERAEMIHIAGGVWTHGFFLDTHAHATADAVFDLLPRVFSRAGVLPVLVERDAGFDSFPALLSEVSRARESQAGFTTRMPSPFPVPRPTPSSNLLPFTDLIARQDLLADLLTRVDPPGTSDLGPFDGEAIGRTRDVLLKKRVDEALPLLVNLSRTSCEIASRAFELLRGTRRAGKGAGIADALRIAAGLSAEARFKDAALRDSLLLRTRFARSSDGERFLPRSAPHMARQRLDQNRTLWALRGLGARAKTYLFEQGEN
jgi:uncharacterized protein (UPF0276 family)